MDLEGWRLEDIADGRPTYEFPAFGLSPGQTVRVYTNQVHQQWGGFSFGYGNSIWSNTDPDTAGLFDSGRQPGFDCQLSAWLPLTGDSQLISMAP